MVNTRKMQKDAEEQPIFGKFQALACKRWSKKSNMKQIEVQKRKAASAKAREVWELRHLKQADKQQLEAKLREELSVKRRNAVAVRWNRCIEEDRDWLSIYHEMPYFNPTNASPWLLRLELDRKRMTDKKLSMHLALLCDVMTTKGDLMTITRQGINRQEVNDLFDRLLDESAHLVKYGETRTLSSREIQTSVHLVMPGELAKHAILDGTKTMSKYSDSLT